MHLNIYAYSALVAAFVNVILALIVYINDSSKKSNILYSIFSLLIGGWAFCCFIQSSTASYNVAIKIDYLLYSFSIFTPALFVAFINTYTNNINTKNLYAIYSTALFLLIVNFTPLFRAGVSNQIGFRYITIPSFGWYFFNLFYTACAVLGLYKLFTAYNKASGLLRKQLGNLFIAFIMLVVGGSFYLLYAFNIKTLPLDNLFNIISGIIITITIIKFRFLNIQIIINRLMAYVILVFIYTILGGISIYVYFQFFLLTLNVPTFIFLIALLVLAGLTFHPLRLHLQTTPDKFLFRKKYTYDQAIKELAQAATETNNVDKVIKIFSKKLKETTKSKKVAVWMAGKDSFKEHPTSKDQIPVKS